MSTLNQETDSGTLNATPRPASMRQSTGSTDSCPSGKGSIRTNKAWPIPEEEIASSSGIVHAPLTAADRARTVHHPVSEGSKPTGKAQKKQVSYKKKEETAQAEPKNLGPKKEDTRRKPDPKGKATSGSRTRPDKAVRSAKAAPGVAAQIIAQIADGDAAIRGAKDAARELREERDLVREDNLNEILAAVEAVRAPLPAPVVPAPPPKIEDAMEAADAYVPVDWVIEEPMRNNWFYWRDDRVISRRFTLAIALYALQVIIVYLFERYQGDFCASSKWSQAFCDLYPAAKTYHEARTGIYDTTKTNWLDIYPDGTRKLIPTLWFLPNLIEAAQLIYGLITGTIVWTFYRVLTLIWLTTWFNAIVMCFWTAPYAYLSRWARELAYVHLWNRFARLGLVNGRPYQRAQYAVLFAGRRWAGPTPFALRLPLIFLVSGAVIQYTVAAYYWLFPIRYTEYELFQKYWEPFLKAYEEETRDAIIRLATFAFEFSGTFMFWFNLFMVVSFVWGLLIQIRRITTGHHQVMHLSLSNCKKWEKAVDARTASAAATKLQRAAFMTEFTMHRGYSWIDTILLLSPWKSNTGLLEQGLLQEALSPKFDIPTLALADQKTRLLDLGKMGGLYNLPRALCFSDFVQTTAFVAWEVIFVRRILRVQAASSSSVFQ